MTYCNAIGRRVVVKMTHGLVLTAVMLVMLLTAAIAQAQQTEPGAQNALIDTLLALPAEERRARLRQMDPSERRGLWLAMKRLQAEQHGAKASPRGAYRAQSNTESVAARRSQADNKRRLQLKAVGTIQYDDNIITNSFGGGAIIGNRFNTNTGVPVLASGTVDTIQAVVVQGPANNTSSAGFVLLGPQTGMGGAFAIFSTFTAGLTATTETITFTGIGANYTGSSFFALFGDFASVYVPAFGSGTNLGQGHHGVVGYTGGMGPNITSTFDFGGALNGLVRAGGNILPVELMEFEVQ